MKFRAIHFDPKMNFALWVMIKPVWKLGIFAETERISNWKKPAESVRPFMETPKTKLKGGIVFQQNLEVMIFYDVRWASGACSKKNIFWLRNPKKVSQIHLNTTQPTHQTQHNTTQPTNQPNHLNTTPTQRTQRTPKKWWVRVNSLKTLTRGEGQCSYQGSGAERIFTPVTQGCRFQSSPLGVLWWCFVGDPYKLNTPSQLPQ